MDIRDVFARNLRRIRHEQGYSQEALAHEAGVDRTYISALERGLYGASIDMVEKLASVLGVEAIALLLHLSGPDPLMSRLDEPSHTDIRIRAARGWNRQRGEDAPHFVLSTPEKSELGRLAQIIEFKTVGSEIFARGDDAGFIYLLAKGLIRTCHTLRNGERQVVAFHWPGDLFGLAEHGRYINSAETVTPARVYRFPVQKLQNFLLKNPKIQDGFLVKATHDLRHTQRQLIVMGRFDIPRRLAAFLLDCSAHEHYFDKETEMLTLPMSRYDIADYLGTSAETITRAFTRLEAQDMLRRATARTLELKRGKLKTFIDFD